MDNNQLKQKAEGLVKEIDELGGDEFYELADEDDEWML